MAAERHEAAILAQDNPPPFPSGLVFGFHAGIFAERHTAGKGVQQARGLAAQGLAGWLALMKGGYYVRRKPSLMMVRPLADPARPFEEAAAEFEAKRKATLRAAGLRGPCRSPDGRRACQRDEGNAPAQAQSARGAAPSRAWAA